MYFRVVLSTRGDFLISLSTGKGVSSLKFICMNPNTAVGLRLCESINIHQQNIWRQDEGAVDIRNNSESLLRITPNGKLCRNNKAVKTFA